MRLNLIIFQKCSLIFLLLISCNSEKSDLERGHRFFNRGEYIKAKQNYSIVIRDNPLNVKAIFYRGLAESHIGNIASAIEDYSKVIKMDRNHTNAYINRGSAWKEINEFERAIVDYKMAKSLDPSNFSINCLLAETWLTIGCYEKAIVEYSTAFSNNRLSEECLVKRAEAYYNKFDYKSAIYDCKKAIKINPKYSPAHNNLAWILATCTEKDYRNGKLAIEAAKTAISLDDRPGYMHTLAAAYAESNMFDLATATIQAAIQKTRSDIGDFSNHLKMFQNDQPLRISPPNKANVQDNRYTHLCD